MHAPIPITEPSEPDHNQGVGGFRIPFKNKTGLGFMSAVTVL